jgi:hypothetical protein
LPEALLTIPLGERISYFSKSDDVKIGLLQYWIKARPVFKDTLKAIIFHLGRYILLKFNSPFFFNIYSYMKLRVAKNSDINKMNERNLAVVFGPPVLNSSRNHSTQPSASTEVPKLKIPPFLQNIINEINESKASSSSPPEPQRRNTAFLLKDVDVRNNFNISSLTFS